ncbi:MAG: hypothetical protein WAQ98_15215 [Blastocatellia bacterium]
MIVGTITVYQPTIIFRFGLPMLSKLKLLGLINTYKPMVYQISSLIFSFLLLVAITLITFLYFQPYIIPYLIGLVLTFLAADRKIALERENLLLILLENNVDYLSKKIDENEYKSLIPHTIAGSLDDPFVTFMESLGFAVVTPVFYGIGVILVITILNWSRWLSLAIFGIGTLARAIYFILFMTTIVGLLAKFYLVNKENNKLAKASFIVLTVLIQLFEQATYFFYFVFLYKHLF